MKKIKDPNEIRMQSPPDGKTQWTLAGLQLDDLFFYKEKGDEESKRLAEWELKQRYAPCVNKKDVEVKMNPHYLHSPQWSVDTTHGFRHRACVTYEDPEFPNPEWYDYEDRISSWHETENKEAAKKTANEQANPNTVRWWEVYLSTLTGKNIQINRVITGIAPNGFVWNAIGQSEIKDPMNKETTIKIEDVINAEKE